MAFGGYIAYTVEGYTCLPFGDDMVRSALKDGESGFDMPLELRAGRFGYRRTRLQAQGKPVFVYSAFIGAAEPGANRPGAFLAVGLGYTEEVNCGTSRLGALLQELLSPLHERLIRENRFLAKPDSNTLNRFLVESQSENGPLARLKAVQPFPSGSNDARKPPAIFFAASSLGLSKAFDDICDKAPGVTDLFVFNSAAKAELQGARHRFAFFDWPPQPLAPAAPQVHKPPVSGKPLSPEAPKPAAPAINTARSSLPSALNDSFGQKPSRNPYEDAINRLGEHIRHIEDHLKYTQWAMIGLPILLIVIFSVFWLLTGSGKSKPEKLPDQPVPMVQKPEKSLGETNLRQLEFQLKSIQTEVGNLNGRIGSLENKVNTQRPSGNSGVAEGQSRSGQYVKQTVKMTPAQIAEQTADFAATAMKDAARARESANEKQENGIHLCDKYKQDKKTNPSSSKTKKAKADCEAAEKDAKKAEIAATKAENKADTLKAEAERLKRELSDY